MSLLDPGYSEWKGSLVKNLAKAQFELLKIDLQVRKATSQQGKKIKIVSNKDHNFGTSTQLVGPGVFH